MRSEAARHVVLFLQLVVSVPAVPVHRRRAAVALFGLGLLLPALDLLLCRVAGGHLRRAELVQDVRAELVGQLASHFPDLAGAAVVPQGSGHLLVGHGLAVALALAPALGQLLLVLGDEVEGAAAAVRPLDGVAHVGVVQGLVEVLVKSELLSTWGRVHTLAEEAPENCFKQIISWFLPLLFLCGGSIEMKCCVSFTMV